MPFWQSGATVPPHLKNIKAAVMTVGGWFDAEDLFGTLGTYPAPVRAEQPSAHSTCWSMGPWPHGGWSRGDGDTSQRQLRIQNQRVLGRDKIELPFLKHFLKDDPKFDMPKGPWSFETGTNPCTRRARYDAWPPKNSRAALANSFMPAAGCPLTRRRMVKRTSTSTSATRPSRSPISPTSPST